MPNSQREYTILIIGLVIGIIVGYALFSANTATAPTPDNGTDTAQEDQNGDTADGTGGSTSTPATAIELEVEDQPAGDTVEIAHTSFSDVSWVAIREQTEEMTPGRILGAQLFPKGSATGTVELLRSTIPAQTYYATVYTDDGDHDFEFKTDDTPVENADGEMILVEFKTHPTSPN